MRSKGLMALVCTFNIWQNIARKLQHVLLNMKAATLLVIKCCGKCIMNCYLTSSYQSFCCFTWGGVCLQT